MIDKAEVLNTQIEKLENEIKNYKKSEFGSKEHLNKSKQLNDAIDKY